MLKTRHILANLRIQDVRFSVRSVPLIIQNCRYLHRECVSHDAGKSASTAGKNCGSPYFITTPIFYVNAAPHVGHLFCALLADAMARWQKVKGRSTLMATGTDEHGLKIQQAAANHGVDADTFCDGVSAKFKSLFIEADIQYDQFIRTTQQGHIDAVNSFWNRLFSQGFIYQGSYAGWYSVSDEAFLALEDVEEQTRADGTKLTISKESGHPVTWMEENNYMFKLSHFQQDLLHWLKGGVIHPSHYEADVRLMLQQLPDLSISRDSKRLSWGIRVPGDDSQTIYVWLDALVNYLTASGYPHCDTYHWPPDCQLIGKDILRFHAIYWPAFLIAAGMEPPRRLICHSHWLVDKVKMSKSLGNVIDPVEKINHFGVDGFRYFLLKEGSLNSDGAYSDSRVAERINSDLANTLGNLLGRCTAPTVNKRQELPPLCEDDLFEFLSIGEREMYTLLYELPNRVDSLYEEFHFTKALDQIFGHLHWANSLVQAHAPWQLGKSVEPRDQVHLSVVLHVAMETLRVCGILLQPVIPRLAERLLTRLGVPRSERGYQDAQTKAVSGFGQLGEKVLLQKKVNAPS
ncbi:methionine--tRNA ligase, mitochondrial [Aplysia californica]|uniref:Methionine--tRNA ligase, mitochondrial n=1 Tax=Aplysia californica TaxID=6500 RepID=A0ABM0JD19_APLCA|nr:methionine--tRNA ligase, mitochondrial [Aplysia californica]XP_005090900.1 methionine--tRNA ligase, mitochondrial [Aplysia californica]